MDNYTRLVKKQYKGLHRVIQLIKDGDIGDIIECEDMLNALNSEVYRDLEREHVELAKNPLYQSCIPQGIAKKMKREDFRLPTAEAFLRADSEICEIILTYLDGDMNKLDERTRKFAERQLGF